MTISNLSQVLARNIDALEASDPLIINLPIDGFIDEYSQRFKFNTFTYLTTNFEQYLLAEKHYAHKLKAHFCVEYKSETKHDLVVIAFPKSKTELNFTLAMIAEQIQPDARIIVVGENKSGIKSLAKLCKDSLRYCNKLDSARHCILYSAQIVKPLIMFDLESWYKTYRFSIKGVDIDIASLPGVFSQKELDIGTKLLLETLNDNFNGEVLDFGCGAGVIASFVGKRNKDTNLTLVDVSALALKSAEKTLALNGVKAKVKPTNSMSHITERFDYVLSNPPFHQGIKTNYHATESFLSNIAKHIKPNGCITIVANSFLKYKPIMEKEIGQTITLTTQKGFSIHQSFYKR